MLCYLGRSVYIDSTRKLGNVNLPREESAMRDAMQEIRNYIINKNDSISEIEDHADIIESRLIDSLQFVDFVFFIEEVTGNKIELESINIEDFRTIDSIRRAFCGDAVSGPSSEVPV